MNRRVYQKDVLNFNEEEIVLLIAGRDKVLYEPAVRLFMRSY